MLPKKTQEEGTEAGLTEDMTDNIAHPHDLATEILSLKHVMTMAVMPLKEDIAKCTLELQRVHEYVTQKLNMTAEMQTVRQRGRVGSCQSDWGSISYENETSI